MIERRVEGPAVAIETAFLTTGLPAEAGREAVRRMAAAVRAAGAEPAFVGVLEGRAVVGLDEAERDRLAEAGGKLAARDLPAALARGASGGTTVSATLFLARRAGLAVAATGGIGGVHPGPGPTDESADLVELSRTPAVLTCSGAKAILDLPATFERLETLGVTVAGWRTREIPAFWSVESGLEAPAELGDPAEAAATWRAAREIDAPGALLVCVPPPTAGALSRDEAARAVATALDEANTAGIAGPALTPFLLERIVRLTGGRSLAANLDLLERNAGVAGEIAVAIAAEGR